jgi:uncharacterized protein (DUF1697 family)
MTAFVALLRAVNVGGTGKLPMSELKEMCEASWWCPLQKAGTARNINTIAKLAEMAAEL